MDATDQEQPTYPSNPAQAQFQTTAEQLGMLTLSNTAARAELTERERTAESLAAEIVQRRLRIAQNEQKLLRLQSAANALQQLMGAQAQETQGGDNA